MKKIPMIFMMVIIFFLSLFVRKILNQEMQIFNGLIKPFMLILKEMHMMLIIGLRLNSLYLHN